MSRNPKKHILDSFLREVCGEKKPPDLADEIVRRLDAGDFSMLAEKRLEQNSQTESEFELPICVVKDAPVSRDPHGDEPTRKPGRPHGSSRSLIGGRQHLLVVAATIVLVIGLIGATIRIFSDSNGSATTPDQLADKDRLKGNPDSPNKQKPRNLEHRSLLAGQSKKTKSQKPNGPQTPDQASQLTKKQPSPLPARDPETTTDPANDPDGLGPQYIETNPLPRFADHVEPQSIQSIQKTIDQALARKWHVHAIQPPKFITVGEWMNRLFVRLLGRSPETHELRELTNYLPQDQSLPANQVSPENRVKVVDWILTSDFTAREFSNHWADRFHAHLTRYLMANRRNVDERAVLALKLYVRQAFLQNLSLAEIARSLVSADGSVDTQAVQFNAAAGYMALAGNHRSLQVENTSRVLLGTELACARCHADPVFEQSRADYLGLAAFFEGTNVSGKTGAPVVSERSTRRKAPGLFYSRKSGFLVYVPPSIAGHNARLDQGHARKSLAEQLTHTDRFSRAMVDWVWTEIYGYGLARTGRVHQSVNAPHSGLLNRLAEQFAAHDFDFRQAIKWTVLASAFAVGSDPAADTLARDIPKYGGVPFFSYDYPQVERDPTESLGRLKTAYSDSRAKELSTTGRIGLNVKRSEKGIEILDQLNQGILPGGLKIENIPDFVQDWGVDHKLSDALNSIAGSETLSRKEKIEHLYLLALKRSPTSRELASVDELFELARSAGRSESTVLQDLWWAIYPR